MAQPKPTLPAPTQAAPRLTEFHALVGHPGPADGCGDCAQQAERQRSASAALRAHRRQARQHTDEILAQVDRCACGVLVLRDWPRKHVCKAATS